MLRRTFVRAGITKTPAQPGPTLYGWGRTAQKRRIEYETVESKYHKREFNKQWDMAGCEQRTTDHMQCRTYLSLGYRWGMWLVCNGEVWAISALPTCIVLGGLTQLILNYHARLQRAAWW